MSKKKLLEKLLEKFSDEELEALLAEDDEDTSEVEEEPTHTHTINNARRGSGHSKRQRQSAKTQTKGKKKRKRRGRISKGKACRVMPMDIIENRPNKFDDLIENAALDAGERRELEEAKAADEKSRETKTRFKKQARANSLVEVECCVCGEEDEVSASMVHDARRWKCNECSTQPGY